MSRLIRLQSPRDNLRVMTDQILALLIAERDKLNLAIEALQGPTKRGPGRPPKSPLVASFGSTTEVAASPAKPKAKKKARIFSEEQKKEQSERMKAMWAAKKLGPKAGRKKSKKAAAAE